MARRKTILRDIWAFNILLQYNRKLLACILVFVFNENRDFAICKCKFNKNKPTLSWNKFIQKHLGDMKRIQA